MTKKEMLQELKDAGIIICLSNKMGTADVQRYYDSLLKTADADFIPPVYDFKAQYATQATATNFKSYDGLLDLIKDTLPNGLTIAQLRNGSISVKSDRARLFRLDQVAGLYQLTADRQASIEVMAGFEETSVTKFARFRTDSLRRLQEVVIALYATV